MTRSLRTFVFGLLVLSPLFAQAANEITSINGKPGPGAANADLVFVVGGDNRPTAKGAPYPRVLTAIFSEIRLIQPNFVVWSGDTIYGYDDTPAELKAEYATFAKLLAPSGVPFFNAPGNHEIHGQKPCNTAEAEAQFKAQYTNLYGSFDYAGVHFIGLNTEECGHTTPDGKAQVIDGAQLAWLKDDLEAHKNARAIFLFFHDEVTLAPNDEDGANHPPLGNSAELKALFAQYPVKAVFQGHEHLFYSPENETMPRYFVAGGAGAPMYAPPEKGGFSHYIVVEMKGNDATYNVVEPGHLYTEDGASTGKLWLINSSDRSVPARRIEASVPESLGACADLVAESHLTKWDGTPIPVPVAIAQCTTSNGRRHLTLTSTARGRSSVPIEIHRRPNP
jgi:3',5'-cyclic AMP phosphodiesterase CpdA